MRFEYTDEQLRRFAELDGERRSEIQRLGTQIAMMRKALEDTARELHYCVRQLRGHNEPVPESSVDRALNAAHTALSAVPDPGVVCVPRVFAERWRVELYTAFPHIADELRAYLKEPANG